MVPILNPFRTPHYFSELCPFVTMMQECSPGDCACRAAFMHHADPSVVVYQHLLLIAWPSGLRRWFKAPVSSEAWVRIPPLSHVFHFSVS
jgi:hypothetical protein